MDVFVCACIAALGIGIAVFGGHVSTNNATHRWAFYGMGSGLVVLLFVQCYRVHQDQMHTQRDQDALKRQIAEFVRTANSHTVESDQLRNLREELKVTFDRLQSALGKKNNEQTPKATKSPKAPDEKASNREHGLVEHIRFTQKQTVSKSEKTPYAVQVIIQTDVTSSPTTLRLTCSENIGPMPRFFVAGQTAMMNVMASAEGKMFTLFFGYPPFKPENPVVVTLEAEKPIEVKKVESLDHPQ